LPDKSAASPNVKVKPLREEVSISVGAARFDPIRTRIDSRHHHWSSSRRGCPAAGISDTYLPSNRQHSTH
jgi:hypothetical protein